MAFLCAAEKNKRPTRRWILQVSITNPKNERYTCSYQQKEVDVYRARHTPAWADVCPMLDRCLHSWTLVVSVPKGVGVRSIWPRAFRGRIYIYIYFEVYRSVLASSWVVEQSSLVIGPNYVRCVNFWGCMVFGSIVCWRGGSSAILSSTIVRAAGSSINPQISSAVSVLCNSNSNVTYLLCWPPWTVEEGDVAIFCC